MDVSLTKGQNSGKHCLRVRIQYTNEEEDALKMQKNRFGRPFWEEDGITIYDHPQLSQNRLALGYSNETFIDLIPTFTGIADANAYIVTYAKLRDVTFTFPDIQRMARFETEWETKLLSHITDRIRSYVRWNQPIIMPVLPLPPPPPTIESMIDDQFWYGHCLLLAQTRLGKTNVIRWRMMQLLPQIARGEASIILMEPKGVLTQEVLRLAHVWGMRDKLIIIDPKDTRVAVNVFDKGDGSDYAINETINSVIRVLDTITTTLTPFQRDALNFCLRAMFYIDAPGSMRLLTTILRKGIKELPVRNLPPTVQEYFDQDFKPGDGSAQQIIARLNGLLANPVFEALFASDHSTFDMFKEIQAGKLIVINASAGDKLYGKFWVEQINACIAPRFDLPYDKRTPTTFIMDEAQTYIADDLHFAEILDKAAEARIGMLIAAHHMGQITDLQVRHSIYTNTTLKFTARTSADINTLSNSMGATDPEFIQTIPQYEFAFFAPNLDTAIKVKFPLVEFDKMPQMTAQQYHELRQRNREKYSYGNSPPPPKEEAKEEPEEVSVDDLSLADAYAQLAYAIRRGDTKRASELEEHIDSFKKKHPPDEDGATQSDKPPGSEAAREW